MGGMGLTVTLAVAEPAQPLALVAVTAYVPVAVTEMLAEVWPVLQR